MMIDVLAEKLKIDFKEIKDISGDNGVYNINLMEDVPVHTIPQLTKQFNCVLHDLAQHNGNHDFQFYIKRGYRIFNYFSYSTANDYHIQVCLDNILIELKLAEVIAGSHLYTVFNKDFRIVGAVTVTEVDGKIVQKVDTLLRFRKLQALIEKNSIIKYLR